MSNEDHDELRDKFDAFSRRLDAPTREFKEQGEFSDRWEKQLDAESMKRAGE
jgi:hypothetical protein